MAGADDPSTEPLSLPGLQTMRCAVILSSFVEQLLSLPRVPKPHTRRSTSVNRTEVLTGLFTPTYSCETPSITHRVKILDIFVAFTEPMASYLQCGHCDSGTGTSPVDG